MKKSTQTLLKVSLFSLALMLGQFSFGQVVFTSVPDSVAVQSAVYTYNVIAVAAPTAATFSLQTAPSWMSINSVTGVITGTPANLSDGGKVVIKAHNSAGDYFQTYNIYITDAVVCDPAIVAYWPMDNLVSHSIPEFANGHDAAWSGPSQPEPTITSTSVAGNALLFAPANMDDEFYKVADQDPFQFKYDEDFSVSFWFKNTAPSYSGSLGEIMIGRNTTGAAKWFVVWDASTQKIGFFIQDNGTDDTIAINSVVIDDNNWHHVVATFNSVRYDEYCYLFLYVDKASKMVAHDFYTDNYTGTGEVNIGWLKNWGRAYSGYLDEVVYYNKELTPTEVNSLYSKGIAHQSVCSEGNIAPIITSAPVTSATEDEAYTYQIKYKEIDGDPITLSAPVLPSWLSFNASTGVLSGTPLNANVGANDVTLRVNDGTASIDQVFVINVTGVNDAPTFSSTPVESILSKQLYQYLITTFDEEGQAVTLTCTEKPDWLTFSSLPNGTGMLTGTPTRDDVGTANVTLNASDGALSTSQTFTIEVVLDNHEPVITSEAILSAQIDELYTYTMTATDEDGDNLTYSVVSEPLWLDFNATTHVLSGIPAQENVGNHSVTLQVTDGKDVIQQHFTISVIPSAINNATSSMARVYPVPAREFVMFEFAERLTVADLQVFSTTGQLMKKVDISNSNLYKLDVSDLKPNNYLYKINSTKGQQTGTFIIK